MGDRWRNRRAPQSTQSRHLGSSRYLQSSSLALPPWASHPAKPGEHAASMPSDPARPTRDKTAGPAHTLSPAQPAARQPARPEASTSPRVSAPWPTARPVALLDASTPTLSAGPAWLCYNANRTLNSALYAGRRAHRARSKCRLSAEHATGSRRQTHNTAEGGRIWNSAS